MCGIFAFLSSGQLSEEAVQSILLEAMKTKHRGPDNTQHTVLQNSMPGAGDEPGTGDILLCFHRLCINDLTEKGNQPLYLDDRSLSLVCNGEIYNYQNLKTTYNITTQSDSDCEIILHLYKQFGLERTLELLDGVYAFVLVDTRHGSPRVLAARDPIGVRSLYRASSPKAVVFASEMKSLHHLVPESEGLVSQFPPGHWWESTSNKTTKFFDIASRFDQPGLFASQPSLEVIQHTIREKFYHAVEKRLMSNRPIGCLLSGGLDSSLVAAILSKRYKKKLKTYSVGLPGSIDLKYARLVADFLGTEHHEVILSEETMLAALEEDIYQIETYDTTTVRASTPMFLLAQYIAKNHDDVVIYSGEGSDEASGSYLYFHNAPSPTAFKAETLRLLQDLSYFDVLRCDKSTAGAGLEVRVPFLDIDFLLYYMNIETQLKMPQKGRIEKHLLRSAFDGQGLLPPEVLWRMKEGMSDGVSSQTRGWYQIIQEFVEKRYTDFDLQQAQEKYKWNPPQIKEALYYRDVFAKHYPQREQTIPYYWLPKWSGNIVEPSARVLTGVYKKEEEA